MAPPQIEEEREKIFYYVDLEGRACVRVRFSHDGAVLVQHKAPNRHWRAGWPDGLQLPFHLRDIIQADPDRWIYIVRDEQEAAFFIEQGRLATCCRFSLAKMDVSEPWVSYFAGRKLITMFGPNAKGVLDAQRLRETLRDVAKNVVNVTLDSVEPGEGLWEWLQAHDFDLGQLDEYLGRFLDQKEWVGLPLGTADEGELIPLPAPEPPPPDDEPDESVDGKWKPFPCGALPEVIADYVCAASQALHCDPSYVALPCLCVAGGALGNARVIRIKATWYEPSVFWGVLIADSSTMKSPAADLARDPVARIQAELFKDFEVDHLKWKRAKRQAGDGPALYRPGPDGDDQADELLEPVARRVCVEDITVEKLAGILYDNPRGVMLIRDELAGWFGSFTRYMSSKGGGTSLPFWLEVFRARGMMIDRKGGDPPTLYIPRAAVSVFGTIQPLTFVSYLTDEFVESGLASRMLMAAPPKTPKEWSEAIIPEDVGNAYHKLIRSLHTLDAPHSHRKGWTPREVEFSREGKAAWVEFYNRWADRQATSDGETAYALAKLEGYCARFALLIASAEHAAGVRRTEFVEPEDVKRAVYLVEWFSQEAQRVYAMLRTPAVTLADGRLLEYIQHRGGEITARALFLSNPSKFGAVSNVRAKLDRLVAEGKGRWVTKHPGAQGGRPTQLFTTIPNETKPNETAQR